MGPARGLGTAGMPQLESPTFLHAGLPSWLWLAAGVFFQCRCGGGWKWEEQQEPGLWYYLARMLGVGVVTEISGLWQPCSGPLKVGVRCAEFQVSWAGLSGEVAHIWHTG